MTVKIYLNLQQMPTAGYNLHICTLCVPISHSLSLSNRSALIKALQFLMQFICLNLVNDEQNGIVST